MTPLPTPPSPSSIQYPTLLSLLTTPTTLPLEIDILPSTHGPTLQYHPSPPALGIPKALLVPLYLHAHYVFFTYLQSRQSDQANSSDASAQEEEGRKHALGASAVMLLWDPNHVTAINFRKRCLLSLRGEGGEGAGLEKAVRDEMWFLASLVTSPLVKHTKSSTLWGHRLWLLRVAHESVIGVLRTRTRGEEGITEDRLLGKGGGIERYWNRELEVVMKAGERHPRNYYAWLYARDLLRELVRAGSPKEDGKWRSSRLAGGCLEKVYGWCLQHPRDISGWSFLRFLLRETTNNGEVEEEDDQATKLVWRTREFVRKYSWRGESIEWFLNSMKEIDDRPP